MTARGARIAPSQLVRFLRKLDERYEELRQALNPEGRRCLVHCAEEALDELAGPVADAALGFWYEIEDLRLNAAGDPLAPAPGTAAVRGGMVSPNELALWLPEYPPRYPVGFSGRRGIEAFGKAKERWAGLVFAALRMSGAGSLGWARAEIDLTFYPTRRRSPDPDSYAVRFITNALVEARLLEDDDGQHVKHRWCVEVGEPGRLGTQVIVRNLETTWQ